MEHTTGAYVLGLDLSLTSTGWAKLYATGAWETGHIRTVKGLTNLRPHEDEAERLRFLAFSVDRLISYEQCQVVGYEDLAKGSFNGGSAVGILGKVHGAVHLHLLNTGVMSSTEPVNITVAKKLATGKGVASKEAMLAAAIHRLGYQGSSTDEADAMWVAMVVALRHDFPVPVELPKAHLAAITKEPSK